MLASAIEFSRCLEVARTSRTERCARPKLPAPRAFHASEETVLARSSERLRPSSQCIDLVHLPALRPDCQMLLRKEVIQPHLPVRLPCYDFTPIADPTFDGSLLAVGPPASGVTNFRGVTGGVYKARERIHCSVADLRLLATPTSRGRVADPDPN